MIVIAACCSNAITRPAIISCARRALVDCYLGSCGAWLSWSATRTLRSFIVTGGDASKAAVADFAAAGS